MLKDDDKTSIGGYNECFQTTHWSEILNARTDDNIRRNTIIDVLLQRYWKPVYCYIRRKGYDNERAKDLTQGFFHEVVLNSNLIRQADRSKGRFRTFLLTALDHYLIDVHRKERTLKNAPRGRVLPMDTSELAAVSTIQSAMSPEQIFHYVWATEMIDQVISQVRKECYDTNKEKHWKIFHEKILVPIINHVEGPSLKDLCRKHNVENETKASNMIITVKRCFRRVLEDQLRHFVQSNAEIEDEFNELLGIISKERAG